jgi:hypothetical protein
MFFARDWGFASCKSLSRIDIPASVDFTDDLACTRCSKVHAILFAIGSHVREIPGYRECGSLCRFDALYHGMSLVSLVSRSAGHYAKSSLPPEIRRVRLAN